MLHLQLVRRGGRYFDVFELDRNKFDFNHIARHLDEIEITKVEAELRSWCLICREKCEFYKSQVATIESVGSSTRIEGVKLTNSEVEALLRGVKTYSFKSRDEQEVADYAELMEMIFASFKDIPFTENHIKQLHSVLLKYSTKDDRHRGDYKKFANSVEAFGPDGKSNGVIFHTAAPFDTPALMTELIEWTNTQIKRKELHSRS